MVADTDVIDVGERLAFPDFTRYTVVAGDTLSALAARFYGDASLYPLIATASGITDPDVIDVGQSPDHPGNHETHGCRGGHVVGVGCPFLW